MSKTHIAETEWYNIREKRPAKRCRVLLRCGEVQFVAQRIGFLCDKWLFDSGFIEPVSQYDLWRPL